MRNILIIDDEIDIAKNIKAILEDENFSSSTAVTLLKHLVN